jgi:hypothetical protein
MMECAPNPKNLAPLQMTNEQEHEVGFGGGVNRGAGGRMGWPELDMEEEKHTTDEVGDTLQHTYIPSRKSRE